MEMITSVIFILAAVLAGAASPGPSFVLVAKMAMGNSRRDAVAASIGMLQTSSDYRIYTCMEFVAVMQNKQ